MRAARLARASSAWRLVAFVAVAAGASAADVEEFAVAKFAIYEQSEAQPTPLSTGFLLYGYLDASPGDATVVTINGGAMNEVYPGEWERLEWFGTEAELEKAYPPDATHAFELLGGTLGTRSESVQLQHPGPYPAVPTLTPKTLGRLDEVEAGEDLLIEWSVPDASVELVNFSLAVAGQDALLIDEEPEPGETSFLIPGALLEEGGVYEARVLFGTAVVGTGGPAPGFGVEAIYLSGFGSQTYAGFEVATPCPADVNGDGLLDFFDLQTFLNEYSSQGGLADWNEDGVVDFFDLLGFLGDFTAGCP